jgi:hypothetical protein
LEGREMKKFLLLVIINITSLGTAMPIWTGTYNANTGKVSVFIQNGEFNIYMGLAIDSTKGYLGNFQTGADAPCDSMFVCTNEKLIPPDFSYFGQGELWLMTDFSTPPRISGGEWLTADVILAPNVNSANIVMYSVNESELNTYYVGTIFIPEPATLLLLSLGGLVLRRVKH